MRLSADTAAVDPGPPLAARVYAQTWPEWPQHFAYVIGNHLPTNKRSR
jgi:hypothetical protein